jgi:hypothetical protein
VTFYRDIILGLSVTAAPIDGLHVLRMRLLVRRYKVFMAYTGSTTGEWFFRLSEECSDTDTKTW